MPPTAAPDRLSPTFGGGDTHRPYFETLFVSPAPAASRAKIAPASSAACGAPRTR